MTRYIACPIAKCEGEIAFNLDRDNTAVLEEGAGDNMRCSEGHFLDNNQQDLIWNEADSRVHEWEVADAEAIVEAGARAYIERAS